MENNINNLPHEDGTNREEDLEKDKKELEKNLNKAVDDAEKVIDDINTAEAKPFKEKLILPEEDDSFLFEELEEEVVDEAVPKELVPAFKRAHITDRGKEDQGLSRFTNGGRYSGYKSFGKGPSTQDGSYYSKIDFQKSEYTPITPEEAIAMKKNGEADKVIAILDDQLVTFNKDGKQLYRANRSWGSDSSLFTRPNGDVMEHSGKLTYATVIGHASKLYKADEVVVPDELLLKRRSNPESRAYNNNFSNRDLIGNSIGTPGRKDPNYSRYGYNEYDIRSSKDGIKSAKQDIELYTNKLKEIDPDSQEYSYYTDRLERAKNNLKSYEERLSKALSFNADIKARARYYSSELTLKQSFEKLRILQRELRDLNKAVDSASNNVEMVKTKGSESTRSGKEKLDRLKQELKDIQRRIIEAEIMLDGCDEDDARELAKVQDALNSIEASRDAKKAELDTLLRRNKTEDIDEECQIDEDIPALNKIKKAGKVGELNNLISDLYPEGITNDQLKDILTYEDDYILDTLGVGEDNE